MAIGYAVKHNRLPLKSSLFYSRDTMLSEESVEVGAVDVDFAAYLREGDEALTVQSKELFLVPTKHFWPDIA